tara:strand:+ start:34 stop:297 length:264 start_codon:yes stop_codon:yes gene_type:complete
MAHLPNVYAIINITDLGNVDFSQVGETSENTTRKNIALTEFVLKWYDEHEPTFIADGTIVPISVLTHAEALTLMSTEEWSEPMPEPE